ncbi:MAG: FAD-binding oxidoreductase [Candidatus Helarchaeota archaeon]
MDENERERIIKVLQSIVGKKYASDDPSVRFAYTRDQIVKSKGPDFVVLPKNKEEIKAILKFANEEGIPVIPKGTGANLIGAVVPEKGGIIIGLKRMNKILEIDPINMTATVEPGVTFGQLQKAAWKVGLFTPEPSGPHTVRIISNFYGTRGLSTYSAKYGVGDRHIIGTEWILPNGEELVLGCFAHPSGEISSNWEHAPGPDLSGLVMFAFGDLGICVKSKVKLYPKMDAHGGEPDNYIYVISQDLEEVFKACIKLGKWGYTNSFIMRWPYIAMMFGHTQEASQKMMKQPAFGAMLTIVLEGTKRRIEFHKERIKKLCEEFGGAIVVNMEDIQRPFLKATDPGEEYLGPAMENPRVLIDYMFMSARAFRVHGAFGGNTPFLPPDEAYNIFKYSEDSAKKLAERPEEIACYFQPIDDIHYGCQEMDLYWDQFDPIDSIKALSAFQAAEVESMITKRDSIFYYLYVENDFMEACGPILFPGYFKLLKTWKRIVDPKNIMNPGKGLDS